MVGEVVDNSNKDIYKDDALKSLPQPSLEGNTEIARRKILKSLEGNTEIAKRSYLTIPL